MYPTRTLLTFAAIAFFVGASVLACANPLYETTDQPVDQPPPANQPESTDQPQSKGEPALQATATRQIDYDDVDRVDDPGCVYIDKDGNVVNPCVRTTGTEEPTATPFDYDFNQCGENIKEVTIDLDDEYECSTCDWKIVVNNLQNEKCYPETITIEWENGDIRRIPLNNVDDRVASFYTSRNIFSAVKSATVGIYASWVGDFYIESGGCALRCLPFTPTPTE